jgi:arginase
MDRTIAVVGAPSNIGIRPYDDGVARNLNQTPEVLRERGIVSRLGAVDLGDVVPPAYQDFVRPPNRARNERQVIEYSRALADRVANATSAGRFALVLGGDCSIVLGCLLGARRTAGNPIGLVYVDAHADFATPEESRTGSVASMCLALSTGRGETPLARMAGRSGIVDASHVALVGRRDDGDAWYGHAALAASPILDLPDSTLLSQDSDPLSENVLRQVAPDEVNGFWIQMDADVLNPAVMAAVDSPVPGGPMPDELVRFLTPLVQHPKALGLSLTIYDPALDPNRAGARQLVSLLETLLAPTVRTLHLARGA